MTIGELIKKYRNDKDYTQRELAAKLDVRYNVIARWESNEVTPNAKAMFMLIDVLEIPYEEVKAILLGK